jgi:hypothetical protein
LLVVAGVLVVGGWLGWHTWNAPYDESAAGQIGTQATEVLMQTASGDPGQCELMRTMARPGDEEAAVQRCRDQAASHQSSPGPLEISQLRVEKVDVDRDSGTVTVAGSLANSGPMLEFRITWPLHRSGDEWRLAGGPDVHVG